MNHLGRPLLGYKSDSGALYRSHSPGTSSDPGHLLMEVAGASECKPKHASTFKAPACVIATNMLLK